MKFTEHRAAESPDPSRDADIATLLDACFDGVHVGRTWFKQIPHERLLARSGSDLMGLVGMEYRVVRVGEAIVPILGIVDLCVAPAARRPGIDSGRLALDCCPAVFRPLSRRHAQNPSFHPEFEGARYLTQALVAG